MLCWVALGWGWGPAKGRLWFQSLNFKLPSPPTRVFQEQEKEARSRAAYISALPASPHWGRGFDEDKDEDEGSPGGCNPAGGNGGDFHRLVF